MSDDRRGALVCIHVVRGEQPLLVASRSEPVYEVDSGWQFLCNVHDHSQPGAEAQLWAVRNVIERHPSLADWIDGPPGTRVERESLGHPWRLVREDDPS